MILSMRMYFRLKIGIQSTAIMHQLSTFGTEDDDDDETDDIPIS